MTKEPADLNSEKKLNTEESNKKNQIEVEEDPSNNGKKYGRK